MKFELRLSQDSPGFTVSVRPWQVTRVLLGIVLGMGVLSLAGLLLVHVLAEPLGISLGDRGDPSSLYSLAYLFNADDEFSPANWYSAIALFLAAVTLGGVALIKRREGLAYAGHWTGLAIIFIILSMGETTVLNDRLVRPSQEFFGPTSSFLAFGWVIPAMILVAIFGLSYLRFFFDLPGRVRWLFLLAGGLYVGGALGLEMLGSHTADTAGLGTFPYELLAFFEETLEMLGVVVLIHAVLTYLESPFLVDDSRLRLVDQGITISRRGWTVLALLLVFAVLLGGAAARNMRPDEVHSFEATASTLPAAVTAAATDVHAPAYFTLFHLWQQAVGDGELTSRVFSALLGMLALAVTFRLGREWLGGWPSGLAALLALGLSTYFNRYVLEIRPYPLLILVGAGSMLLYGRWLAHGTRRSAIWYGLSVALVMYTHYLGAFLVLLQAGHWLATRRRNLGQAVLAWGGALLLWLPWFPVFLRQLRHEGTFVTDSLIPGVGKAGSTLPTTPAVLGSFASLLTNGLPLLIGLLLVAGLWRARRDAAPAPRSGLIALWALGIPALVFAVNLAVPIYEPRYIAYITVGMALLIAASLRLLPGRARGVTGGALLLLGLLTVGNAPGPSTPVRAAVRGLEAAFQPGDIVLARGLPDDGIARYHFTHYAPTAAAALYAEDGGKPGTYRQPWTGSDADLPRCVWFGTASWGTERVIERFAALEADRPLMATAGDPEGYLFQRLCLPPEEAPQVFGGGDAGDSALRFLGADILRQAPDALELALWWEVDASPAGDLTFGVYLLDAGGALAAQQDGPLIDYWSGEATPTSALEPGRIYIDRRVIALPDDLPPGSYALMLAVYHPEDGTRLPVGDAPDNLLHVTSLTLP
ncbi:MAG: glycosyltransferase family 39 protein [Anaerolineae bacterium]|nr:glycosyltransferase family 39 protein [Anaerolineae bacterium]